jgi:myo-inositol-1(or 4)-monophosphatase
MFIAEKGRGATVNGKHIRPSQSSSLIQALISTGFPTTRANETNVLRTNFPFFQAMLMQSRDVRRNGSAALDLCYVACSRHDLYWEQGLKAWDVAAGALILQEAGGTFTDMHGHEISFESAVADEKFNVFGSNGPLHTPTLAVFESVRKQTGLCE